MRDAFLLVGTVRARTLMAVLAAAALVSCGTGDGPRAAQQPRGGRAGVQLSGTVAGAQVAVSDGGPRLIVGDCRVVGGAGDDVCFVSRDLRGKPVTLAFRNPDVLQPGQQVPVEDPGCVTPADCTDVTGVAVVDLIMGEDVDQRAVGGMLTLAVVQESLRYAGEIRLELPDGRLSGVFDVVPRPE